MSANNFILGTVLMVFLMGCQQPTNPSSKPTPEPEVAGVATSSTGEMFYLEPEELARQRALAEQGDNQAAIRVADHYGLGEADPKGAYPWLTMAAERGDIGAMRSLGVYLSSEGGPDNCQKALSWLERAKREGSQEELQEHGIEDTFTHLQADFDDCVKR